ncbi:G protein alpha subunit [Orpheovirus IHUMI-LCC2]|uniref:G protein alpha subunit n=1 Tax=Orpheovirus IHUMI-LCC2 TaxID=2023057 RepID=A0A2I2L402_9VIRU|nr:G protein alpha subunit [Orpheovirus IHUMI-LCC2]SNW62254.1 G protein alpha subunit [Orpheovirus IHUMI-LCC2]
MGNVHKRKVKQLHSPPINNQNILVLGLGGSGKSTFIKQLRLLYGLGYSNDERLIIKDIILHNLKGLLRNELGINVDIANSVTIHDIEQAKISDLPKSYNLQYLLGRATVILSDGYLPNDEDILHSRMLTSGLNEIKFTVHSTEYKFFDVGGQASERRKWVKFYQGLNSVVYVINASSSSVELEESITLLLTLQQDSMLFHLPFIIMLNKIDLLEKDSLSKIEEKVEESICNGSTIIYKTCMLKTEDLRATIQDIISLVSKK